MSLRHDTLLLSAKICRKESLADGELLPFARICRKESLAQLQPDGELSGFCCSAWKTSTHPCGVSTHVFLSSGNFTISSQRISKTLCVQIYKPSHRKSSCNVSQGSASRCSSLPFQGVGDNLFHLWGGSGTIWAGKIILIIHILMLFCHMSWFYCPRHSIIFFQVRDQNIVAMCKEMGITVTHEHSHTLYNLEKWEKWPAEYQNSYLRAHYHLNCRIIEMNAGKPPLTYKQFQRIIEGMEPPAKPVPTLTLQVTNWSMSLYELQ